MKYFKNNKVKYNNMNGIVIDIIIEKRQISIWVEFDNKEIGLFNHEGYLYQSDKQYGDKYKLIKI